MIVSSKCRLQSVSLKSFNTTSSISLGLMLLLFCASCSSVSACSCSKSLWYIIMYGMSASNMHKLQSAQNSLTRVVLPSFRHLSANERLSYLHWLPVHYRILFKIATLTLGNLSAILSLQSPPTTPAITSSPFFNPAISPCTIYVYRF